MQMGEVYLGIRLEETYVSHARKKIALDMQFI